MEKRKGIVTIHENPLTLLGNEIQVRDMAPDFTCIDNDLNPVSLAVSKVL